MILFTKNYDPIFSGGMSQKEFKSQAEEKNGPKNSELSVRARRKKNEKLNIVQTNWGDLFFWTSMISQQRLKSILGMELLYVLNNS